MAFYNDEYKALLRAQRTLTAALESRTNNKGEVFEIEPRDAAMVASALTRVIDQKRVMRGQPAPKPIDVSDRKRQRRRSAPAQDHDLPSYPDSPAAP